MERKKLLMIIVSACLVTVVAVSLMGGCRQAPPEAPPEVAEELPIYSWRFQDNWMPEQTNLFTRYMADLIEEGSGGRVSITTHSAAELVPMEELFQAVEDGTIQLAQLTVYNGVPIDFAGMDGAPPFLWSSALEARTLFDEKGLEEIYAEAYEGAGNVHYIGMHTVDPINLITNKPVTKYEDFAGLRIYSPPEVLRPFIEAGAVSMVMSPEECMVGLQSGVLDGMLNVSATEAGMIGLNEILPYYLYPPIAVWTSHIVINRDLWNSLPSDLQTIIEMSLEAMAKKVLSFYEASEAYWRPLYQLSVLSDEDLARLRASQFEYYEELAQTVPAAAEILRIVREYQAEREVALMD